MSLFQRTLGGLQAHYYFRQLFFGALLVAGYVWLITNGRQHQSIPPPVGVYLGLCVLLYPYARFCYETCMRFILGDTRFRVNAAVYLVWLLLTMSMTLFLTVFLAPIGLLMLYFMTGRRHVEAI